MQDGERRLRSIYLCFRSLWSLEDGPLHGRFVLLCGPGTGEQEACAARICGAATLLVPGDPASGRRAAHMGAVDFSVSNLDEALRILKNALRRRAAVGICLRASVAESLAECVERGVQPEYFSGREPILEARGARLIPWEHSFHPEESPTLLPLSSESVLKSRSVPDEERRHWLLHASPTLGRAEAQRTFFPLRAGEDAAHS